MSETSTSKQIFVTISTHGTSSHTCEIYTFVTCGPDLYKLYLKRRAFWGSRRSLGSHPPILPKKGIFEPNIDIAICTQQNSRLTYNLRSDSIQHRRLRGWSEIHNYKTNMADDGHIGK